MRSRRAAHLAAFLFVAIALGNAPAIAAGVGDAAPELVGLDGWIGAEPQSLAVLRGRVALDPELATWNAYGNRYWPAFYFIDRRGVVRHVRFGEGGYAESEAWIERLLAEPAE